MTESVTESSQSNAPSRHSRSPFEALFGITNQTVAWIGKRVEEVDAALEQVLAKLNEEAADLDALKNDIQNVQSQVHQINEVPKTLFGSGRTLQFRPALASDVVQASAFHSQVPDELLTITVAPETPFVFTDTSELARALSYLFQNALEAEASHVSANITPTLDGKYVAISIADDGIGIAEEDRDRIWGGFFSTKGSEHSGLGLPGALVILSRLGGRITCDSESGKGAVFTVVLPAAHDDYAVELNHAPGNIFFVDEEDDTWALFASNVLKLAGKEVVVQGTPAGASGADLILIDEALTTMDVDSVLAELNEAGLGDKSVVVTAWLEPERAARYMSAGARDVALKPYTYTGLSAFLDFETQGG